jgi:hypothetical protein
VDRFILYQILVWHRITRPTRNIKETINIQGDSFSITLRRFGDHEAMKVILVSLRKVQSRDQREFLKAWSLL